MVLVGNPRSPETSKKISTLGCLNLQCPVVWGFRSTAAHGLCHCCIVYLASDHSGAAGAGLPLLEKKWFKI